MDFHVLQENKSENIGMAEGRFFGRDLTNLEGAGLPGRDARAVVRTRDNGRESMLQPSRSVVKGAAKVSGLVKPSPVQFYKGLFENQRSLHRRGNTNEKNKSGSIEQNQNLSKSRVQHMDPEKQGRQDMVKHHITRLLRSRGRLGGRLAAEEESSQGKVESGHEPSQQQLVNQGVSQDLGRVRGGQAEVKKSGSSRQPNHFGSLANIGQAAQNRERACSRRTPSNATGLQKHSYQNDSGCESRNQKAKGPALAQKFKNLRLQLDERQADQSLPGNPPLQSVQPSQAPTAGEMPRSLKHGAAVKPDAGSQRISNELDELPAAQPLGRSEKPPHLGLDVPFIWEYLLAQDRNMCDSEYFDRQTGLNEAMRKILIDWLVDVHRKFKLRQETLFIAINLVDRYLLLTRESVPKSKFQLYGIACLFIASKYEEIYPPGLGDFVYVCADTYCADQILEAEGLILNKLGFNLVYSSCMQLFGIYACQQRLGERERNLTLYLLFLCLLSCRMSATVDKLRLAACLFLCGKILQSPTWSAETFASHFRVKAEEVKAVALDLFRFVANEEHEDRLTAVRRMFNHSQFSYVSTVKLSLRQ